MEVICPSCRAKIATDDINVSTDVALCRSCGHTFRLSEIMWSGMFTTPLPSIDLNSPPSGAWYTAAADGFTAGATTRSWMSLFLVPFTCVWAGGSMSAIYGTQIMKGQFSLFPSLFGIPFLVGSIFLVSWCAMAVAGKVMVSRDTPISSRSSLESGQLAGHAHVRSPISAASAKAMRISPAGTIARVLLSVWRENGRSLSDPCSQRTAATSCSRCFRVRSANRVRRFSPNADRLPKDNERKA